MIANSPAFKSGKKPLGECAMKYAKAMSPARMNATGRVNKPSTISTPPTSSIIPLMPERYMGATPVEGETGKLKYFDVPCSRNSKPTMMRKILSTRGDHVARKLSIADIIASPTSPLGFAKPSPRSHDALIATIISPAERAERKCLPRK
jgi:hypothetical protein